jgi:hypothetical protein
MTRERFVRKLEAYQAWYEAGGHTEKLGIRNFRVLTVTKSEERMVSLFQAAAQDSAQEPGRGRFWFSSEERVTRTDPASVFGPVWEVLDDRGRRRASLLP